MNLISRGYFHQHVRIHCFLQDAGICISFHIIQATLTLWTSLSVNYITWNNFYIVYG